MQHYDLQVNDVHNFDEKDFATISLSMQRQRIVEDLIVTTDSSGAAVLKVLVPDCDRILYTNQIILSHVDLHIAKNSSIEQVNSVNVEKTSSISCTNQKYYTLDRPLFCDLSVGAKSVQDSINNLYFAFATPCNSPLEHIGPNNVVKMVLQIRGPENSTAFVNCSSDGLFGKKLFIEKSTGLWLCDISDWFLAQSADRLGSDEGHTMTVSIWKHSNEYSDQSPNSDVLLSLWNKESLLNISNFTINVRFGGKSKIQKNISFTVQL